MKGFSICKVASLAALAFGLAFLTACGDDDSFSPVAKTDADQDLSSSSQGASSSCHSGLDPESSGSIRHSGLDPESSSSIRHSGLDPESSSSKGDGGSEAAMTSSSSSSSVSLSSTSSSSVSSSSAKSSSSLVVSSASKEDFFNPDIDYGTLTDDRDGQVYKTVEINGITWMAENLNFAGNSDWTLPRSRSYCYGGIDANCALYGRLYDRAAAMNSTTCDKGRTCSLSEDLNRGVCPNGWHIPTEDEVDDLMDFTFGDRKTLRSAAGWFTTESNVNGSGLSLVGSGVRSDKNYVNEGRFATLWYYSIGTAQMYLAFSGVEDKMWKSEVTKETVYVSVRCVKN